MNKVCGAVTGYKQIGAFSVHESTLMAINGWRPHYWKFLTFETRKEILASTLNFFSSSLETHSIEDVAGYDEQYCQWVILRAANKTYNYFWYRCFSERNDRHQAIENQNRVPCGARKKTGHPCKAKAEPGSNRCRFHGGKSTGPKTIDGKIKSLSKLSQYQRKPHLLIAKRKELVAEMREKTGF